MSVTAAAKTVNTPSFGKNSTLSLSRGKRRFILICHFCNRPGHIRPKCFEYQNTFKMGRFGKYNYKSRVAVYKPMNAPKHKIDLKTNHVKKIWVKKSDLNCCVASPSLKTVSTNSCYFARGCSRHFTGEREFFKGVSKKDEVVCLTEKVEN